MADSVTENYTSLLNYLSDDVLDVVSLGDIEGTGSIGTSTTTADDIGSASSDMLSNLTTDETDSKVIAGGDLIASFVMQEDTYIKNEGVTAYNDGTGYYLGWDGTLAAYVFFIGNSSANKLTWNGTTLSITGSITATTGTIGGWVIGTDSLTDAAGVVGMSSAVTGGDDIRFWAGDATPGSAEFRVTEAGALTASSATITGSITATSGDIGGWVIVAGYIYNLQTGTPTASPNDGVVLASGNEAMIVYEDTAKRLEVGYLSAGIYGLKGYATDGTTVLFELSDTQTTIAGWNIVDGYLYNLQSGTPTSSPNDGIVLASGNEAMIIYEDTAKRVEVGYLSAGVYGLKVYATDGTTVIFQMSDTEQKLAGWNFTNLVLRTGTTDANSNVLIDSANSLLRLGPTTGDYITIDGANKRIRSSDYVSGVAGAGFTLEPDLLEVGNISARGLIRTAVFQKSVISAVGGSFAVIDSDKLNVDMTALDASTLTISGNTTFAVGDLLRIKDGVNGEWLEVTNIASAPTYTVTRDKAASYAADTNPAWKNGASVVNYRQSGNGLIYMTASDTDAPFLSVLTHAGLPWTTLTTQLRLGNLNGYLGYVADIYGLGVGSVTAGEANITIEPTNGIRIRSGTTNLFTVDMAGNATIGGWTLGATTLTGGDVTLSSDGNITVGTLNNVVRLSTTDATYRLWIGNATAASAPFRVTPAGVVTAADINLTTSVQYQGVISGITGTELETLSAGTTSNADALHTHPDLVTSICIGYIPIDSGAGPTLNVIAGGFSDATTKLMSIAIHDQNSDDTYIYSFQGSNDVGASVFFFALDRDTTGVVDPSCGFHISTAYWTATNNGTAGDRIEKNGSPVTISGTTPAASPMLGHDPTNSYLLVMTTTTQIRRYSGIAGTTITFVDNITLDTAITQTVGFLFDNTNTRYICLDTTNNLIRRFNSVGTTIDTASYTVSDTNIVGLTMINDRVYLVNSFEYTQLGSALHAIYLEYIPTTMTR